VRTKAKKDGHEDDLTFPLIEESLKLKSKDKAHKALGHTKEQPALSLLKTVEQPVPKPNMVSLQAQKASTNDSQAVENVIVANSSSDASGDSIDAEDSSDKLAIPSLLDEPQKVLRELGADLSGLKSQLEEKKYENRKAIRDQKIEYERRLKDLHNKTALTLKENMKLRKQLEYVSEENLELRMRAKQLQHSGSNWRNELDKLKSNITQARENITASLAKDADDENLLAELKDLGEFKAHSTEKAKMALVQLGQAPDTLGLLRALSKKLDALDQEQTDTMASMFEEFSMNMAKQIHVQEVASEEQRDLKESVRTQLELRDRLKKAVAHLQATETQIKDQVRSIWKFTERASTPI